MRNVDYLSPFRVCFQWCPHTLWFWSQPRRDGTDGEQQQWRRRWRYAVWSWRLNVLYKGVFCLTLRTPYIQGPYLDSPNRIAAALSLLLTRPPKEKSDWSLTHHHHHDFIESFFKPQLKFEILWTLRHRKRADFLKYCGLRPLIHIRTCNHRCSL